MSNEPESSPPEFPLPRREPVPRLREVGVRPLCIIIAGPTASGKTDIAIHVAKYFQTEIISADSRQCYKEMNIGTAKPSPAQLAEVPHHFINSHSITDELSAADFERFALAAAEKIFEKNNTVVMCGGTGLYIKAFCEGLDDIPSAGVEIKKMISENFNSKGLEWLQQEVKENDPLFWETGEVQNPHRLIRALEVVLSTGKSIQTFRQGTKKERDFDIVKLCLDLPREILYERINHRAGMMREAGLAEEARQLLPYKNLNALQTVGYRELFDFFDGKISEEKAFELIKQNTRHYAKRQVTWFKKEGFEFVDANNFPTVYTG
jgi:tRNA dimethylallyltransferase